MTLRAYLTLLRPVRTLLFAAFYGWAMGFNLLKSVAGQTLPDAFFLTFAILGPVLLGSFFLGPIHELMHRNTSMLLPGCRTELRRWHLSALGLAALVFLGALELTHSPYPRIAAIGFVLAGLTVPLVNPRRSIYSSAFLGMGAYLALVAFLALPSHVLVLDASRTYPWAIFAAGLAATALCIRRGFAEESVRERSRSAHLVVCIQTAFPFVGSGGFAVTRYAQAENGRLLAAQKAGRAVREWTITSVGTSLREWRAVVHHCRFGGTRLGQLILGLLIIGASPLLMVALIQFFISRTNPANPIPMTESFGLVANAFHPGATPDLISTLLYVFALLFGLIAASSFAAPVVLAAYRLPISRLRLAQSTLIESFRLNALIATAFATELSALALGTTLFSGDSFAWSCLSRPIACSLVLIPTALLLQAFIYRAAQHFWLMAVGIAVPLLAGPAIAGAVVAKLGARAAQYSPVAVLDLVFTPIGFVALLTLTGLAAALHWLALRRHFHVCDFSRPLLLVAAGRST